jgi:hypothetical protein
LPWAAGLVGLGLLSREMTLGRWLLAGFLVGHGLIHLLFVTPAPAPGSAPDALEWPFDMAKSWLVTGPGLDVNGPRCRPGRDGVGGLVFVLVGFDGPIVVHRRPGGCWSRARLSCRSRGAPPSSTPAVLGVAIDASCSGWS